MNVVTHTLESEAADSMESLYADRLIGVWNLVSYIDEQAGREDVHPFGPEPQGFLIYTPDGFVSAQLMKTGRPAFLSSDWDHGTPEEYRATGSGYIAYSGTYEIDEGKRTVTHIPFVSLLPNLIGGRQCRSIELEGDRLVLRAAGTSVAGGVYVTSRLEWKRAPQNAHLAIRAKPRLRLE
jgi:Lipocalin-like domain